jgi:hypothetical protein
VRCPAAESQRILAGSQFVVVMWFQWFGQTCNKWNLFMLTGLMFLLLLQLLQLQLSAVTPGIGRASF